MKMQCLIFAAAVLVAAVAAQAVDVWGGPPEGTWQREDPGSTWQHWNFSSPELPAEPEEGFNPYGVSTVSIIEGEFEWGEWSGPDGEEPIVGNHVFSPEGGILGLWVRNTPNSNKIKNIFIQLTSSKAPLDVWTIGEGSNPGGYVSGTWDTGLPQIQHPGEAPFDGVWYTYNYGLTISPNPESEMIFINVPYCTVIDQIVVDTICVPEPATLALLALGGLAMIRRRH